MEGTPCTISHGSGSYLLAQVSCMKQRNSNQRVLVLDIEATGLHPDSYPIEIAYANPLESWVTSSLIKPHPDWGDLPWDERSKALTGITETNLMNATSAEKVAKTVAQDISKADIILSDAPAWDERWLNRLLAVAHTNCNFEIQDFLSTINNLNPLRKYLSTYKCLNFYDKSEHRAAGDVIRLLRVYRRAIRVPLFEEQYCPIKKRGFGTGNSNAFVPGILE
jgi:DNA polymerase III alpha subunit (gram-positive type)